MAQKRKIRKNQKQKQSSTEEAVRAKVQEGSLGGRSETTESKSKICKTSTGRS